MKVFLIILLFSLTIKGKTILINVSRGGLINEEALIENLNKHLKVIGITWHNNIKSIENKFNIINDIKDEDNK